MSVIRFTKLIKRCYDDPNGIFSFWLSGSVVSLNILHVIEVHCLFATRLAV